MIILLYLSTNEHAIKEADKWLLKYLNNDFMLLVLYKIKAVKVSLLKNQVLVLLFSVATLKFILNSKQLEQGQR